MNNKKECGDKNYQHKKIKSGCSLCYGCDQNCPICGQSNHNKKIKKEIKATKKYDDYFKVKINF